MSQRSHHELVRTIADIKQNIATLRRWRNGSPEERKFYANLIKNGKVFVAKIEAREVDFAPSRFAGYLGNDLAHRELRNDRDGRITNPHLNRLLKNYIGPNDARYPLIEATYLAYCQHNNVIPTRFTKTPRRYWILGDVGNLPDVSYQLPDETGANALDEGSRMTVIVNKYERSVRARQDCIAHYGATCAVCSISFEDVYGERGSGFIHVHHIVPVSKRAGPYTVDPIRDLRPVCPNCHAMLHIGGNVISTERLRSLYQENARRRRKKR